MMIGGTNGYNNDHPVGAQNDSCGGPNNGGVTLKKGPWTAAEDAILAEYVRTHGEGNWNAVQEYVLPGRTDNEIKNFWNTRVKRRQRQGLPLYPPEIQALYSSQQRSQPVVTSSTTSTTSSFSFQNPMTKPLQGSMLPSSASLPNLFSTASSQPQFLIYDHSSTTPPPVHSPSPASTPPPLPSPSTPPPLLLNSPRQSLHAPSFSTSFTSNTSNTTPSSLDFYFQRSSPSLQQPLRYKRFKHDGGHENNTTATTTNNNGGSNFMLPFSSLMKTDPFNHNSLNPQQYYLNSFSLDQTVLDLASSSRILQPRLGSTQFMSTPDFGYPFKNELSSSQFFAQDGNNSDVTLDPKGDNNYGSNDHNSDHQSSSLNINGNVLLEDMLKEAQALTDNHEIMGSQSCLVGSSSSSDCLASDLNAKEETKQQIMNTTKHEDNSNVNQSSVAMTAPEWYIDNGEGSNGQSSAVTDETLGFEFELHDQIAPLLHINTAPAGLGQSSSSHSLDHNFPGIC
ncbi:hypothetical protein F3Y22_tig00001120pilonHSYRG00186 [Hibiscus syriacus]|uniref:Uncharacterized protein n=1 Tax=Hibiscus syriacus TaxID=106335 RepID=A0A6A3D2Q3_HIBSY|nr:hypothetical protein F3Y22_tig00001120pilonHSYRG00186 [Hibiscus syriacus]